MINKLAARAYENMILSTEMTKHAFSDPEPLLESEPPSDSEMRPSTRNLLSGALLGGILGGFGGGVSTRLKMYRDPFLSMGPNTQLKRKLVGWGGGAALGLGIGHLVNVLRSRDEEE